MKVDYTRKLVPEDAIRMRYTFQNTHYKPEVIDIINEITDVSMNKMYARFLSSKGKESLTWYNLFLTLLFPAVWGLPEVTGYDPCFALQSPLLLLPLCCLVPQGAMGDWIYIQPFPAAVSFQVTCSLLSLQHDPLPSRILLLPHLSLVSWIQDIQHDRQGRAWRSIPSSIKGQCLVAPAYKSRAWLLGRSAACGLLPSVADGWTPLPSLLLGTATVLHYLLMLLVSFP